MTQAYPYCWHPAIQYFFPECICEGFDHYETAWDFLLGLTPIHTQSASNQVPQEPPEISFPSEPTNLDQTEVLNIPPTEPHEIEDTDSMDTYDYNTILPSQNQHIPIEVHIDKNDILISSNTNSATLFLTAASNKALSKYNGKSSDGDDINEFIYKLRIFLNHPSISNCHCKSETTETN